jgi:S1-C subfamily serine protease
VTRATLASLLAGLALVAGGCSLSDDSSKGGGDTVTGTRTVERTRVNVVEDIGKKGGFDPQAIYKELGPGVVTVISLLDPDKKGVPGEGGLGSGFILDGDGHIATNAHVVLGEAPKFTPAKQIYIQFADGNRVEGKVIGTDLNSDVALIKIDPAGLTLTPLRLGQSHALTVGDPVAAIGSPFGEEQSLSVGVISAVDRDIESLTQFRIGNAIQTDAAINRGNSGGPLLDAHGRVIGINSQIKSSSGGGEGVGFAVPIDVVKRSLSQLEQDGKVDYGFLGVSASPLYPQLARKLGLPAGVNNGALVASVEKNSPAAKAGLSAGSKKIDFQGQQDLPADGDVIVSVDGKPITQTNDLKDMIGLKSSGSKVTLDVLRDGKHRTVVVTLAPRPSSVPSTG